ncbi:MAG: hypothetical protein LBV47_06275 [Bacteroidales bacterium]|jgi:hypothetical protein|nr:hypothetical protein [Bacteroidales bacterium]
MKRKLLYVISAIFTAVSIFLILKAENAKELLLGISTLSLFGVGGAAVYALERKGNRKIERQQIITLKQSRRKLIVLLWACLAFVLCGLLCLPFFHLFDDSPHYTPTRGYIIGIAGMLFFGFGAVASIIRLIKPEPVIQISDGGLLILKGKRHELIRWDEIQATSHDDHFLFIHLSSPDAAVDRTVSVPVVMIEYGTDEIENLIREKIITNRPAGH